MTDAGNADTFLLFSDVHLDPFADPTLVKSLAASPESSWKAVLSSSSQTAYPAYGSDSNYALFESALSDMAARAGNVATIIFPGDILSHKFNQDYAALTGDASQAGVDSFIQKTVDFFVQEVESRFPSATVIAAIGNNDSVLGDYGSVPGDPYLALTAPAMAQAFFKDDADRASFSSGYSTNGYYTVEPDGPSGIEYIVLNSVYWTPQYADPAPGTAEMSWFASQLAQAARNSRPVYVVSHVPTGANAVTVAASYAQTGRISYQGYMNDTFNNAFTNLELSYSTTIAATFTGHTHNDDFRLITAGGGLGASELMRISPSITPYSDDNPGYQVYSYDPKTRSLLDETTYNLNLQARAPAWGEEYDYAQTYGQSLATPQDWAAAYAGILTDPACLAAYVFTKNGGATSQNTITAANAPIYQLALGYTTPASFNAAAAGLLAG